MRRTAVRPAQVVGALGGALLLVGLGWSLAALGERSSTPLTFLLLAGAGLALAGTVWWVLDERRPRGLVVPEAARLRAPRWEPAVLAVGAATAAGGALASRPTLVAGAVLLAAALLGLAVRRRPLREEARLASQPEVKATAGADAIERPVVVAARRVQDFGTRHAVDGDAGVSGAVEHIARGATRLVLVGRDGALGDVVVSSPERAVAAAALAGLAVVGADERELADRMRTGPYLWRRMAGLQLESGPRGTARKR
jgi:hypothetical protein